MTCAFSNLPKFLDNPANTGSTVTGKIGSMLPPGREIDGKHRQPLGSVVFADRHGQRAVQAP